MFEIIVANKEWLFSGVGVVVITAFYTHFFNNKLIESGQKKDQVIEIEAPVIEQTEPETEVSQISQRLALVLELMNEKREYSKFTIAQLAQIMKLHKVSELEDIFRSKEEPTFEFIERFCDVFGVNKTWVIEGKRAPFSNDEQAFGEPLWYLEVIENLNPQRVFFVRKNSKEAPAFIMVKLNDYKFKIFHRTWHISDEVGAGGQRQLVSFYELVKALRDEKGYYSKCGGLTLDEDDFKELFRGDKYPGVYTELDRSEDPWWDDLTDINHSYPISANYGDWHGKSFLKAQEIIKWKLQDN
ncbi:helix-turn-helix transcriptional regulator [Vibrio vulnificus]|nr:helix-turn-helix transcriptional regulator [Vibrio vulnificus]ELH9602911.1 helix-turn-helix transcriptional regulator [Vibrio vulnificus]ELH9617451.1 helix-turn-helix transcriptional regulator [Vibrio vulnificus]